MAGANKLMTAGGGGVTITPATSIASDVTVLVPSSNGTLVLSDSTTGVISATAGISFYNQTIANSVTITSGYSALSVGPVSIAAGQTVTVPAGSRWVVA